jgi:branched-chain amino acid transport system substrate-binding protein
VSGARVAGRKVEIVRGCSEIAEHTVLIEEARRLVEVERVDAIVGPVGESDSLVLREIARKHPEVAFLPAWSGAQELTLRDPAPNVYRFDADEAQDVAGLGSYAYRELGWRRAAVVSDLYGLGWQEEAAFVAEFCALGGLVTQRSRSAPAFLDTVGKDASVLSGVDGVALLTSPFFVSPVELITTLSKRLDQPERQIVLGMYVVDDKSVVSPLARPLNGVVGGSSVPPASSTAAMKRQRKEFQAAFPGLPPEFAEGPLVLAFHDNMEGLLRALEAADANLGDGRTRLHEELARLRIDVPGGPVRLDRNRQAIRNAYLKRIVTARDGTYSLRLVRVVPKVEQTFGGLLSNAPPPGPGSQPCRRGTPPPWAR